MAAELDKEKEKDRRKKQTEQTLKRLASYDLACGIDNQLNIMTGAGFDRFAVAENDSRPLHQRPHLTLCWDTGSDNVATSSYLLCRKRLRVSVLWDPPHKVRRCIWNATRESGKFSVVLLGSILCNLERGAWNGEANFQSERAMAKELALVAVPGDPLLRDLSPKILRDRGLEASEDSSLGATVLSGLNDAVLGTRISGSLG